MKAIHEAAARMEADREQAAIEKRAAALVAGRRIARDEADE